MNVKDALKFGKEESVDNDCVENHLKYGIEEQNTTSSPSVDKETVCECVFKRGGLCKIHGIVGQKVTRSGKKWVAKKNGIFGSVTSKSTVYICKMGKISNSLTTFNPDSDGTAYTAQKSGPGRPNNGKVLANQNLPDKPDCLGLVGEDYQRTEPTGKQPLGDQMIGLE